MPSFGDLKCRIALEPSLLRGIAPQRRVKQFLCSLRKDSQLYWYHFCYSSLRGLARVAEFLGKGYRNEFD